MTYAQQFFDGLTGPASLTFLGLLLVAFLLGALPTSFAYATRARRLRRRLGRREAALAEARTTATDLRQTLAARDETLAHDAAELASLRQRLRQAGTDRQNTAAEATRLRDEVEALRGSQLAAQIEARGNADEAQVLRGRLDALNAQLQSLRQSSRAQTRPPAGAFDVDTLASLQAARRRAEGLEARLAQVTADNEALRRQLS